jgi:uncharacterized membrane protein YgcG
MIRGHLLRVALMVAGSLMGSVHADERILSFQSDILIAADGSMTVEETIRMRAEGRNVRRGIFRDFPTDYTDGYGNRYVVDFEVLDVRRDGGSELWHTEERANGVRVYVGSADRLLAPSDYDYTIRYRTTRQIGFFESHDELYWNVTGNGWAFLMDEVGATVTLPQAVLAAELTMAGYTGPVGAQGQDYVASVSDGRGEIRTTRPLGSAEGLTLVMTWPKGVVTAPSPAQKVGFLMHDNRGLLIALLTLAGVSFYLYMMWARYGRDPDAGVVFAHYEPPEGYSPASARYISAMRYDDKVLSAAVINLAVKGYLTIDRPDDDYVLSKTSSREFLAPGERALLKGLFSNGPVIELEDSNHATIKGAMTAHKRALQRDYLNTYFKNNTRFLLPALAGSILAIVIVFRLDAFTPAVVASFLLIAALLGLFAYLLKTPTEKGRRLMDRLEGFKLYLNVAEKDDLNLRNPPDLTPALFERYLPFAIALGVEQAWAEQFTAVFASLESERSSGYQPRWYRGDFNAKRLSRFANNVGNGFAAAISSASTPPGSASGAGGGGSSGGGGGGGGGGSW